jgi:single-strand DNA-binding protein
MANFNFNKTILGGKLTSDPELKTTPNGTAVTQFTIAVNRKGKDGAQSADFINCVAWEKKAEFVTRYFRKGSSICAVGSIQTRSWKDQNGNSRFATEVNVDETYFVDSKGEVINNTTASTNAPQNAPYNPYETPQFEEIADDEELPF